MKTEEKKNIEKTLHKLKEVMEGNEEKIVENNNE